MSKILGYIIMIIGLALIVLKLGFKDIVSKIPILSTTNNIIIILVGIIIIVAGFLFLKPGKDKQEKEVPIYEGKKVVGYRRQK